MRIFTRWFLIGMVSYTIGHTIWVAATGSISRDIGVVITGAIIGLAGVILLLTSFGMADDG